MSKPILVIMAAGMGSRYGGLKQIDPVDEEGHIIIDFSLYDAKRAGFERAIFIIKKENEQAFREVIGDEVSKYMEVNYVFQDLNDVPDGFVIPEGRQKPWGTAHALNAARDAVHEPFVIINADDFYGHDAFKVAADFLNSSEDNKEYAMVGYQVNKTLSPVDAVKRGVADIENGFVVEHIFMF